MSQVQKRSVRRLRRVGFVARRPCGLVMRHSDRTLVGVSSGNRQRSVGADQDIGGVTCECFPSNDH